MTSRRTALAMMASAPLLARRAIAAGQPSVLHVTYVTAPFNVPLIIMFRQGLLRQAFAARGITIDSPTITSGAAQMQAIAAGAIDIASVLGDTSAILAAANGVDLKVVGAFSRSPKAFTIMGRPGGPTSIDALKGRKVAGPKGTTLNQLLAAALASRGLTLADVQYLNMDIPAARAALLAGQVDAATLAGSDQISAEAAGAKVITTGDGLIAPTSVIAVAGPFLRAHPDLVKLYLETNGKALAWMSAEPDKALEIAAAEQKMSLADARRVIAQYDFSPVLTERDLRNMERTQAFLVSAGMLQKAVDIGRVLIDPMAMQAT